MKSAIELEAFAANCKLPEGLRFKEWNPGCIIALSPDSEGQVYLHSDYIAGVERISDGKVATFEITELRKLDGDSLERGKIFLTAESFAHSIDTAIAELEEV